jgi:hypothetical protein
MLQHVKTCGYVDRSHRRPRNDEQGQSEDLSLLFPAFRIEFDDGQTAHIYFASHRK